MGCRRIIGFGFFTDFIFRAVEEPSNVRFMA